MILAVVTIAACGDIASEGPKPTSGSCVDANVSGACADAVRAFMACWNPTGTCSCKTDDPPETDIRTCTWQSGQTYDSQFSPSGVGHATWSSCLKQTNAGSSQPYAIGATSFDYDSTMSSIRCMDGATITISECPTIKSALDATWPCTCTGPLC